MPKFKVEIEEISQRVEEIEANNLEEALDKAEERYSTGEIVLDYEDFKEHEIREYRNQVREEDLVKDNIIPLNYGQAILLEGDKNLALLKQIGKELEPYIIVTHLHPHRKYGTYFEWDNGSRFNSIAEASKEYEKRANINKHSNDIDFSKLGKQTLENSNISKFNGIDNIFRFLIDDEMNKEEIISWLSDEMKEELVLEYNDSTRKEKDEYFYGEDMFCFEEEISEKLLKINNILQELHLNKIDSYNVLELLEQNECEYENTIDKKLENDISTKIKAAGYDKSINDFIDYINKEIENEEEEEEENEHW